MPPSMESATSSATRAALSPSTLLPGKQAPAFPLRVGRLPARPAPGTGRVRGFNRRALSTEDQPERIPLGNSVAPYAERCFCRPLGSSDLCEVIACYACSGQCDGASRIERPLCGQVSWGKRGRCALTMVRAYARNDESVRRATAPQPASAGGIRSYLIDQHKRAARLPQIEVLLFAQLRG